MMTKLTDTILDKLVPKPKKKEVVAPSGEVLEVSKDPLKAGEVLEVSKDPLKAERQVLKNIVPWQVYAIGGFFILKWVWGRWKKPSNGDPPSGTTSEDPQERTC
ncbi:uncharacterized protein [Rutidosis leptorrhynchoides]|uniref:uncharacterized protein isoform X2 n=1 Tax=Rutidosis leptorrhynchoides TaxID=125765 RepID=UPI003A998700